jgi:hypothetical protein
LLVVQLGSQLNAALIQLIEIHSKEQNLVCAKLYGFGSNMQFNAFIEWAFLGLVSGGIYILYQMKESMSSLNEKIGVLIVQHEQARKDLDDHEERIRDLEKQ